MTICLLVPWCTYVRYVITALAVLMATVAFSMKNEMSVYATMNPYEEPHKSLSLLWIIVVFMCFCWYIFDRCYACVDDVADDVSGWPFGLNIVGWIHDNIFDNSSVGLIPSIGIGTFGMGLIFLPVKLIACIFSVSDESLRRQKCTD